MPWDWINHLDALHRAGKPFASGTVIRTEGSAPCAPGARILVERDGTLHGTVGGGNLERLVIENALAVLASGNSDVRRFPLGAAAGQCCGGAVEVFFEVLGAGPELYLFGAGHVAQAIALVLDGTTFRIHAVDEREEWLRPLPPSVTAHAACPAAFVDEVPWDGDRTHAIILTHRHDLDQQVLEKCLRRPRRYLGLIGSDTKWRRFRDRLAMRDFTEEELRAVRCPIGLADWGKSPKEIAIAVAAELLSGLHRVSR